MTHAARIPLFTPGSGCPEYLTLRDDSDRSESRAWFEQLWAEYEPLNPDVEFLSKARVQFIECFWQAYLAHVLRRHSFELIRPAAFAPDIGIVRPRLIWVEATCPSAVNEGKDRTTRRPHGAAGGYTIDRRAIQLRYTAALKAKAEQHAKWCDAGAVSLGDPYIIAICGAHILDADAVKGVPEIVKAVLGIDDVMYVVPIEGGDSHPELRGQRVTLNRNGSPVHKDQFLTGTASNVSGVLFAARMPWSAPPSAGAEFIYVPNPTARTPLKPEFFSFAHRWVTSGDESGGYFLNHVRPEPGA